VANNGFHSVKCIDFIGLEASDFLLK